MTTDTAELLVEWPSPGICRLRMNRPQAYNALSRELVDAMRAALPSIWDQGGRVTILAAGTPGFCSGADLKQRKLMSDEEKYAHNRAINALANEIAALPMPVIASINGVAMGGGCELALACDIRFASASSRIGLTEARLGAMPGAGGSQRLPRLVGVSRALEMMYSGDAVDAERALAIGLVDHVVTDEALDDSVLELAVRLARGARRTARLLKEAVYKGLDLKLDDALDVERQAIVEILASADYQEGLAAFAERRPPNFS
jgi:enoyl-CoA hydratase/carnithine racemase